MRIIFMGTPDFAVPALVALNAADHEIVCVYSQPPSHSGRGKKLRPSPVHATADSLGIAVRTPKSLRNEDAQAEFAALQADIAVVAAYGLILPRPILDAPRLGCVNIHASILPRWRGAAPIHRALMAGDEETGVTIMQMEAGLDTGPMLHIVRTPIAAKTTGDLTEELAKLGADAMVDVLGDLSAYPPNHQDDALACYAPKIDKAEARINWSLPAKDVVRHIHGLAPFPGAWFELGDSEQTERVKLLQAEFVEAVENVESSGAAGEVLDSDLTIACAKGAIRPIRLQRAGKPAMSRDDFLRGRAIEPGTVLN